MASSSCTRRCSATLVIAVLLSGLLLGGAPGAAAHGISTRSVQPKNGATVRGAQQVVTVRLTAPATLIKPTVTGPDGVTRPVAYVGARTGEVVRLRVRFRDPGRHVVSWGIPQTDGHLIRAEHVLQVQETAPAAPAPPARSPLQWLLALLASLLGR